METTKTVHKWQAGEARQRPETFMVTPRVQRIFRARIYLHGFGRGTIERLCDHDHLSERDAKACAVAMAEEANRG